MTVRKEVDPLLLEPTRGGKYLVTSSATILELFVAHRGRKVTTWRGVCRLGLVSCVHGLRGLLDGLVAAGYLQKLKNGWRLTDAGEAEIRKIRPDL